ncbi:MAG: winged helix DNA-binding domain-containing protein, partial [Chloroflexota bacterium]|nr:winged helix DNA-binding domain-containing protein [Chloroflexota bacterium]
MHAHDIAHVRLFRQGIAEQPFADATEVVRWLTAVQAQDYAVARWSVAQRARAIGPGAIDTALANGSIVRTHVLRPTWHFVAAEDLRWMQTLTAPRVQAISAYGRRQNGLDTQVLARAEAALERA